VTLTDEQVNDLCHRLERARGSLRVLATQIDPLGDNYHRLRGKIQGIGLALSYLREYTDQGLLAPPEVPLVPESFGGDRTSKVIP
jgi:hypothetical protein